MRTLPPLAALRVFETAARQLSFTRAAQMMHVSQGAVSRQIKLLEDYMGRRLFVRNNNRLALTETGHELLEAAQSAFDRIEASVEELRDPDQRQRLAILAAPTFASRWLAPRLAQFRRTHPKIELVVHHQADQETSYDCVIRWGIEGNPRLSSQQLFLEQHVAVCAPSMLDRARSLQDEPHNLLHIVEQGRSLPGWTHWLEAAGLSHQIDAARGVKFSTQDQVIQAVKAGEGFAVIDQSMIVDELEDGRLAPFSPIQVSGPYGYWLDIPLDRIGLSKVGYFARWIIDVSTEHTANQTP